MHAEVWKTAIDNQATHNKEKNSNLLASKKAWYNYQNADNFESGH